MNLFHNIRLPFDHDHETFLQALGDLGIAPDDPWVIVKKSLDARKRNRIYWVYSVQVGEPEQMDLRRTKGELPSFNSRPVIVGSGPAGMFCAHWLLLHGVKPILIEQGAPMEERIRKMADFMKSGAFDSQTNIGFGAGGAGTYSDGKLYTRTDSPFIPLIMDELIRCGADPKIKYYFQPHLGSEGIRKVIERFLKGLEERGAEIRYHSKLTDLVLEEGELKGLLLNGSERLDCETLFLATGHSARETYYLLDKKGISLVYKPFAVGARIEHPVEIINQIQYGDLAGHPALETASYRLTKTWKEPFHRTVYSFCMCPGGYVLNSSTDEEGIVTNGMSNRDKRGLYSNAALVVNISEDDLTGDDWDRGIRFQKYIEESFAKLANPKGGVHHLAGCGLRDFLRGKKPKGEIISSALSPVTPVDFREVFPPFIVDALGRGLDEFNTKMRGFVSRKAHMIGPETRTSAPVRVLRDKVSYESVSLKGLYPIGEGSGYAGGIMSAAVDGVKGADAFLAKFLS